MIKYNTEVAIHNVTLSFSYGKMTESSDNKRLPPHKAQSVEGLETLQTQKQSTTNCLEEMNKAQGSI